jgi:hypothetical protein
LPDRHQRATNSRGVWRSHLTEHKCRCARRLGDARFIASDAAPVAARAPEA